METSSPAGDIPGHQGWLLGLWTLLRFPVVAGALLPSRGLAMKLQTRHWNSRQREKKKKASKRKSCCFPPDDSPSVLFLSELVKPPAGVWVVHVIVVCLERKLQTLEKIKKRDQRPRKVLS